MTVTVGAGTGQAELSVCGGFAVNVDAGSEVVITCASVVLEVVSGAAEIDLGGGVTVSVPAGATAEVTENQDGTFTVDSLGDNGTDPVTVNIGGVETPVNPDDPPLDVNQAPTADAGGDQTVAGGSGTVNLDGTASSDPDGDALTYAWTQTGGAGVTLSGADTATPSFTAPSNWRR